MNKKHQAFFRVYYEDTDAGGIVYYANYLKFAERARTEWLRALGCDQSKLWQEHGIGFVVRHCAADFLLPAKLDDVLTIETHLQELTKVRMRMQQTIARDKSVLVEVNVTLACINKQGKPFRFPKWLNDILIKKVLQDG